MDLIMGDLPRLCWKHYIMLYSIYAIFLKERKEKKPQSSKTSGPRMSDKGLWPCKMKPQGDEQ